MAGLSGQIREVGDDVGSCLVQDLIRDSGGNFKRLQSGWWPKESSPKFTVTLRQTFHNTHKNSDERVWRAFAMAIGATVIEDHSVEPIGLHERFSLYAGARMNYGVPNGPVSTIFMTEYPVTIFADPETTAKGYGGHEIQPGDQFPCARPHQRIVWERATLGGLLREYQRSFACA